MLLTVIGKEPLSPLTEMWRDALAPLEVQHPNLISRPHVRLGDAQFPIFTLSLDRIPDNLDPSQVKERFQISTVKLKFFPGVEGARLWFACVWAGFLMHEALELVAVDGRRVADPHTEPYERNPFNRCIRDTLPSELTLETLHAAIGVVTG